MENLQPKLRFPEFREEWIEKTIGKVIKFRNGKGHEKVIDSNGDFIVVNSKYISTDGFVSKYTNELISPLFKNDIVMVMSDLPNGKALAKCLLIEQDNLYTLNQRICALTPNPLQNNPLFLKHIISRNSYFLKLDDGVNQTNLKKNEVLNCPLTIPTLQEQTKIADFLGAVDKQLDILNQKKEKLNLYKKGTMQQLFSQQIRFKDDNGNNFPDWEEKRLLDFKDLIHGDGDWILAKDIDSEGNINVIQLGNIGNGNFIDKDYKKITTETFNDIKGTPIKKGDFLINRMLNNYKLHSCLFPYDGDYITSVDVCWIRENNYFNNYFLKSLFSWEKSQEIFVSLSSGSGRIRISKKNLFERFVFKLPSLKEQIKIANFLSAIDTQIEAVENQITKTETYKKGLLQQMFV